jgi:hypothetical protein
MGVEQRPESPRKIVIGDRIKAVVGKIGFEPILIQTGETGSQSVEFAS